MGRPSEGRTVLFACFSVIGQCAPGAPLELMSLLWPQAPQAPAPSVSCGVLCGRVVGAAICVGRGVGWVLYDLVWWEQVVVVVPVLSFGASDWFPERQGDCGCGLFVGVCLVP